MTIKILGRSYRPTRRFFILKTLLQALFGAVVFWGTAFLFYLVVYLYR